LHKQLKKTVLSQELLTSRCKRCRNYAPRFHWYKHCFIEFSTNFKQSRGQIVFSI